MQTPRAGVRLDPGLIEQARQALGFAPGTPVSEVIRAAVRRIAGVPDADGHHGNRMGRPPKNP